MTETIITSRQHPLVARCRDAARRRRRRGAARRRAPVAEALAAGVALSTRSSSPKAPTCVTSIAALVRRGRAARGARRAARDAGRAGCRSARCARRRASSRWPRSPLPTVDARCRRTAPRSSWSPSACRIPATSARSSAPRKPPAPPASLRAGTRADPFGWKALRGSMGSAFRLPVARIADAERRAAADAGARLRARGLACRAAAATVRGRPRGPRRRLRSAAKARACPRRAGHGRRAPHASRCSRRSNRSTSPWPPALVALRAHGSARHGRAAESGVG